MLLRPATPEDAMDVARVHVRAWQLGYRGLLPAEYLDRLDPAERAQRYRFGSPDPRAPSTLVAEDGGVVCGFATTAPAADTDAAGLGELCALYVDPQHWGRGIGVALVAAARAHLTRQGFRGAVLWLLTGNARGDRFYRADRWIPDGSRRCSELWGATVDSVRYRRALEEFPKDR